MWYTNHRKQKEKNNSQEIWTNLENVKSFEDFKENSERYWPVEAYTSTKQLDGNFLEAPLDNVILYCTERTAPKCNKDSDVLNFLLQEEQSENTEKVIRLSSAGTGLLSSGRSIYCLNFDETEGKPDLEFLYQCIKELKDVVSKIGEKKLATARFCCERN